MSTVPYGYSNNTTAAFEENTPVVSGSILSVGSDPLPPDGTVEYQLLAPFTGVTRPIVDLLVDIIIEFGSVVPPGEIDNSNIVAIIAGNIDRPPNYNFDTSIGSLIGISSGNDAFQISGCGIVKIQYNQPLLIKITREGGNPAVTMTVDQVYRKFKRLD